MYICYIAKGFNGMGCYDLNPKRLKIYVAPNTAQPNFSSLPCVPAFLFTITTTSKNFNHIRAFAFSIRTMDYEHMIAKFQIICVPNSNFGYKAQLFVEIMIN